MFHKVNTSLTLCILIMLYLFARESTWFLPTVIAVVMVFTCILSLGILFTQVQYFYPATTKNKSGRVILTFDDGPDKHLTEKVLDILEKYNIKALFFIIGEKAKNNPEVLQKIYSNGHYIGNHTENHNVFFAMLSSKKIGKEIDDCSNTIKQIVGTESNLFRPPVGYMNPTIARALKKRHLRLISWNLRSFDTLLSSEKLLNRLLKKTKPGCVVLLHDNLSQSVQILEKYIQTCLSNGIIFANQEDLKTFVCD